MMGNINSETQFDDDINVDDVIIMDTSDVNNYKNFVNFLDLCKNFLFFFF